MKGFLLNKKMVIVISIILICLILFALAAYFLSINTGVNIDVTPKNTTLYLNGEIYQGSQVIKLKTGDYSLNAFMIGYQKKEVKFTVGLFKKTELKITLDKLPPLIGGLPFNSPDPENTFSISGYYNDFSEPVYFVSYSTEKSLAEAKKWLNSKGVSPDSPNVQYLLDGD